MLLGEKKLRVLVVGMLFFVVTSVCLASDMDKDMQVKENKLKQAQTAYGLDHRKTIDAMRELAYMYDYAGRFDEALQLQEKVVAFFRKNVGEKKLDTLYCIDELAASYVKQGRVEDALPLAEKNLMIYRELGGSNNIDTVGSEMGLATIYSVLGRYADALVLYENTLKEMIALQGEKHPDTIGCMNNLALTYHQLGRLEESKVLSEKVVQLNTLVLGEKNPNTLDSIANLANVYRDMGRGREAQPLLEKVLAIYTQVLGENHSETINSMVNLANLYNDEDRTEEALALNKRALQLSTETLGANHPNTLDSLVKVAGGYYLLGRNQEAIPYMEKAVAGIERLRSQGDLSNENRQTLFAQYNGTYQALADLYVSQNQPVEAFRLAELSKARTLLESSAVRLADQSGILEKAELDKIHGYDQQLSQLNKEIAKNFSQLEKKIALETQKDQLLSQANAYRKTLMDKYPKYAKLSDVQIVDAEEGKELIPEQAVFISYMICKGLNEGDRIVNAFTLDRQGNLTAVSLGTLPHLDETLVAYSKSLQGVRVWRMQDGSYYNPQGYLKPEGAVSFAGTKEISTYLGEKLLLPLQEQLKDKRRWIVSASGALALVPIEAMVVAGQVVIDRHDVNYIQSLSMLKLIKTREQEYGLLQGRMEVLAMGAAEYPGNTATMGARGGSDDRDDRDGQMPNFDVAVTLRGGYTSQAVTTVYERLLRYPWQNLPTSEDELNHLATIFGDQATIYRKQEASEEKLLQLNQNNELEKYRYIIFSTHGYFCPQEPGLSAVVLNQVHKTEGTDGYVTAVKWPSYNLKSDLMFLSACETGVGRVIQGEGIMGLPFALYVAGNSNTVFTLWQVVDESSTKFTEIFFAKIQEGKPQAEALNETKREMRANPHYTSPLYWAPYVMYGI